MTSPTDPDSTPPLPPAADLLLAAIIESSDDAILSKDLNGIITSWNKSAERIFGYTRAEAVGRSILMLLPADRAEEEVAILARIRRSERVDHFETIRRRKDGQLIDVSVTISPLIDASGKVIGASKVARDISEQKRSTRASLLLSSIVSSSEDGIVSKNLNGIITSWNDSAQRIFGYTPEEAVGQSVLMLVPPDRRDEEPKILARLQRGERVEHFETIRVRKNGEQFPVSLTISPVRDAHGVVVGASKIVRDITELRTISAELEHLLASERLARSQAEHANRMKDDFLATVSHELRTPLNAILGWAQVMKESNGAAELMTEGIETIRRNAMVQAQLIEDLLDLGRIVSGKMTLDVEDVDLASVINDAIGSVHHAAQAKEISIKKILHEGATGTTGDKKRLQQVVWNILSNAIKFTPKNGRIEVMLKRINSQFEIVIADNGKGIAPSFLLHVFERFRQADAGITRQHGGLGIGLAIVKQLVEMHGGEVRVESPGPGLGSTFTVTLPVVSAKHHSATEPTSALHLAEPPAAVEDLSGIKVLIVDDDKDSLVVVKRVLEARQAQVQIAASVDDALRVFPLFLPHVILSDIGMPNRDGYELIRTLRAMPNGKTVPAAALTALARADDRMKALRAGFQTHIAKPVVPAELVAVVQSLASLGAQPN